MDNQNRLELIFGNFVFSDIENTEKFSGFFLRNKNIIGRESFIEEYGSDEYYKKFVYFMTIFFNKLFIRFLAKEARTTDLAQIYFLEEKVLVEPNSEGSYRISDTMFLELEKYFSKTPKEISTLIQKAGERGMMFQKEAGDLVREKGLLPREEWSDYFYDLNHARGTYSIYSELRREVQYYAK